MLRLKHTSFFILSSLAVLLLGGCGGQQPSVSVASSEQPVRTTETKEDQGVLDFLNQLFTDEGSMLLEQEDWLKQHCSEECLALLHDVAVRSQGENAGYWGPHLRGLQDGIGQNLELESIAPVMHNGKDMYAAVLRNRMMMGEEDGLYDLVFLKEMRTLYYECEQVEGQVRINQVEWESTPVEYDQLPDDVLLIGEGCGYRAFQKVLKRGGEDDMSQVELWLTDKDMQVAKKLLTTHTEWQEVDWEKAAEYPVTQIMAVDNVHFVQNSEDDAIYMVINGCPDARNVFTYLMPVTLNPEKALFLPAANGFHAFNKEQNELVCSTYAYYDEGGRYDIVKVFDFKGNVLRTISQE